MLLRSHGIRSIVQLPDDDMSPNVSYVGDAPPRLTGARGSM